MPTPSNALNITSAGIIKFDGTATFSADTTTTNNVLVGGASNAITSVAPSATSGVPVISQGAGSDPAFGTMVVSGGGTGVTSNTVYAVLCGGTTSTGAIQSIASVGTNPQVLTSNGAGALPTFKTVTATFTVAIQTFTASGTYTPTAGMQYCIIEALGGGGAGGGAATTNGAQYATAVGGAGGEYARGIFSAATIGVSQSVTIGAGGTPASGTTGGAGGNTSVGALISANGGPGGTTSGATAGSYVASLAEGGTGGSGGSFRTPGQVGNFAYVNVVQGESNSGPGGSSQYGAGGINFAGTTAVGGNGLGYGSGGAGSLNLTSQSARSGGSGAGGIVIVTEFI